MSDDIRHHDDKPRRPAGTSGYPEPQPMSNRKDKHMPESKTPHEPQNNPQRKPQPSP